MSDFTEPSHQSRVRARREQGKRARLTSLRALPQGLAMLSSDILVAVLSWVLANAVQRLADNPRLEEGYVGIWVVIWILLRAYQGLYPGYGRSPQTELRLHTVGTVQAAVAQFAVTFAVQDFDRSRLGLGMLWLLLFFLALPARYLLRALLIRLRSYGRPISVIGAGKTGSLTIGHLLKHPGYGLNPVAAYDDNPALIGRSIHGVPVVGPVAEATREPRTQHAIISIPGARAEVQRRIINETRAVYPITWATPDFFGVPNQALVPHSIGSHATLEVRNNLGSVRARFVKRSMDLVFGALILILASPAVLLITLLIRLDSPGPAVYKARRLGRDGQTFGCYKFRTMQRDADLRLEELLARDPVLREEYLATHKLRNDPRITRVGHFLRRTSLDELPQLLNVIRGQMSLVGPRPIVQAEVEKYADVYRLYSEVRPGMTGYWQVNGRSDTSYEERVGMDQFYVTNWTPWLDAIILVQTVRVVLLGRGAY